MKRGKKCLLMLGAFLIPVIIMIAVYRMVGIYPFGDKTVMTIDLNNQYVSFFSYYQQIIKGEHGIFYTFSKTLGGEMYGLNAYYLMSPLNLILLLFSLEQLPIGIEILTLVKIGLCGMSFYVFCCKFEKTWQGWIFSTAYALMAYNIIYQQNIMWLDGIILLPIMIWGIRHIFQKGSPWVYLVALCSGIITNYYIGFMMCIFSVLFFLYEFFCEKREHLWDWGIIRNYALSSAIAGGMSMWLLYPVLKSLSGGKAVFDMSMLSMTPNFYWNDFFVKLFQGSFDYEQIKNGMPNVFCGMISLLFLAVFFLNRKIELRKKIGAAALFVVVYVSFYLNGFNLIWHGFNPPAWFPYRYSFVFSFLILFFAWEGFQKAAQLSVKEYTLILVISLGGILFLAFWMHHKGFAFMNNEKYLQGMILVLLGGALYWGYLYRKSQIFIVLILVLGSFGFYQNGVFCLSEFKYAPYEDYQAFIQEVQPAVAYVKSMDDGFYRMEKTFSRNECDPMRLDYNGLSHYSSTEKNQTKYFMGQMGFRNNGNWSYYNRGSTYATDSLLGVKYILSKTKLGDNYELLNQIGDVGIYQNKYVLPLGFMAKEPILSVNLENAYKFQLQNEIWNSITGQGDELFQEEKLEDIQLHNVVQPDLKQGVYQKEDNHKKAYLSYIFTAKDNNPVFAYFGTQELHKARIEVNGTDLGKYFDTYQYDIVRLGSFQEGERVEVRVYLKEDMINITDVWIYEQNENVFSQMYDNVSTGLWNLESFSDTKLIGSVENKGDKKYLFVTIPNDEGWVARVDGKIVPINTAMGIFMGIEVPQGLHQVELSYQLPGLNIGLLLTFISVFVLILWISSYVISFLRHKK